MQVLLSIKYQSVILPFDLFVNYTYRPMYVASWEWAYYTNQK